MEGLLSQIQTLSSSAANATRGDGFGPPPFAHQGWPLWVYPVYFAVIIAAAELIAWIALQAEYVSPRQIIVAGKPLLKLTNLDLAYICFNKSTYPVFIYQVRKGGKKEACQLDRAGWYCFDNVVGGGGFNFSGSIVVCAVLFTTCVPCACLGKIFPPAPSHSRRSS